MAFGRIISTKGMYGISSIKEVFSCLKFGDHGRSSVYARNSESLGEKHIFCIFVYPSYGPYALYSFKEP